MASLERSDGEELWLWRDDGSCGCGICKLGDGFWGGKERMEDDRRGWKMTERDMAWIFLVDGRVAGPHVYVSRVLNFD